MSTPALTQSLSYGSYRLADAGADARAAAATPWFVPALSMLPLSERRCLVRNPLNAAAMELSSGEYAVLAACAGCQPLAAHAERAAVQLSAPSEHRPAFRELLERCARQGLLLALPDLVARFGQAQPVALPPPEMVIRTADRPQLLLRLLQGAEGLAKRAEHAYRWHVVDDSRHEASRRSNRTAIAACSALGAVYHDLSLPESLEAELCAALPRLEAEIRLLLSAARGDEPTFGRPINYLLLRFAGRRVLMLDDDVVLDPRRPALSRAGVEVSLAPEVAQWYETAAAGLDACPAFDLDPLAEHARWLGLPLAQAWPQAEREAGGLRVEDLPPPCGSAFAAEARVLFTRNHVLGDPGWARFASQLLLLAPATRQWLSAHPDAARYAFAHPSHWRGRLALRLAPHQGLSTTTLTGFDATALLPPTERCTRDADILLGEAARCVYPGAWQAELPFALPHWRDAPRQWLRPDETLMLGPSLLLITQMRATAPDIRAADGSLRMQALGACLLDLGAASDATLRALLEEQHIEYVSRIRFGIEEQLADASLPGAWQALLRQWSQAPALKLDRAALGAAVVAADAVRRDAQGYGRTLVAWPQIWSHCRERCAWA